MDEASEYWAIVFKTNQDGYEKAVTYFIPTPSDFDLNIVVKLDARIEDDVVTEGELQELRQVVYERVESKEVLEVDTGSGGFDVPPPAEDKKNDAGSDGGPSAAQPHKDSGVNGGPSSRINYRRQCCRCQRHRRPPVVGSCSGRLTAPVGCSPSGGGGDAAPATARRSPGEWIVAGS